MKRTTKGIVLGSAVFAATVASAAALGVNSAALGAGTDLVASCDDQVDVSYTTQYATNAYNVTGIQLSGVHGDCAGQTVLVTLADGAGTSLRQLSGTAAGSTLDLPVTPGVSAGAVENVTVVITG